MCTVVEYCNVGPAGRVRWQERCQQLKTGQQKVQLYYKDFAHLGMLSMCGPRCQMELLRRTVYSERTTRNHIQVILSRHLWREPSSVIYPVYLDFQLIFFSLRSMPTVLGNLDTRAIIPVCVVVKNVSMSLIIHSIYCTVHIPRSFRLDLSAFVESLEFPRKV